MLKKLSFRRRAKLPVASSKGAPLGKPPPATAPEKPKGTLFWKPKEPPPKKLKGTPLGNPRPAQPEGAQPRISRLQRLRQRTRRLLAPLRGLAMVGAGVVIALAALTIFSAINPGPPRLTSKDVEKVVASAMASATPPPAAAALVYQAVAPSLVKVSTQYLGDKGDMERGQGTGIILDERGTILTSLHVVKSALNIKITFADGTEATGVLAASQPEKDIAVLRTLQAPQGLVPATLGNPRFLHPGDDAIVIGNPFGLTYSLTTGAISGLSRTFVPPDNATPITGLIQFDAAVNPGNSGGPLLNRAGEVVGIVTGLVNPTGQDVFIGIGFAVPIDVAAGAAGTPPY